ncbi:unnamed protein product [Didymodactylos carnosus]|uniref:Homeobox domain-containing protein n=1 Tax=Didymodactylos carnosus TaxID=1234261 RepID=A0A813QZZ7_9BILA|nr:unnamed protein product [Didymodactylos carnosus]CAF0907961.1 unnamed protein product [Didymodactylos carnosus]CAF3556333.1 unnamed protein product [Didymodactylos carnosus]CAF3687494.1 unnamed protein product [Didymodactylos carnosus]
MYTIQSGTDIVPQWPYRSPFYMTSLFLIPDSKTAPSPYHSSNNYHLVTTHNNKCAKENEKYLLTKNEQKYQALLAKPFLKSTKKLSFDIESILKKHDKHQHSHFNTSIDNDTLNNSSIDDCDENDLVRSTFCASPISSYTIYNQLKSLQEQRTAILNFTLSNTSPLSENLSDHYRVINDRKVLFSPSSSPSSTTRTTKAKRIRTIFTSEQLEHLEAEFEKQQYMVGNERYYLATTLNLSEAQWFQNRRIKWRRQALEEHQHRLSMSINITDESSNKNNDLKREIEREKEDEESKCGNDIDLNEFNDSTDDEN